MESHRIHCVVQIRIASHLWNNIQRSVFIGRNNPDAVIGILCLLIHIIRKLCFIFHTAAEPFNKIAIRIGCLIFVRVNIVHHIAIFLIRIKNGLFVPFIHGLIAGPGFIAVPLTLHPCRHFPAQEADLHLRIDCLCICCQLKSGTPGCICRLILKTHGTGICSGGIVSVISHLHLYMIQKRMLPSKKYLQKLLIFFRRFLLVIHQKVACAVSAEQSIAFIGKAVFILRCRFHIAAFDYDLRLFSDLRNRYFPLCNGEPGNHRSLSPVWILDLYSYRAVLTYCKVYLAGFFLHVCTGQYNIGG